MRWKVQNRLIWHNDSKYRLKPDRKAPSKLAQTVKDFLLLKFPYDILYEEYRIPRSRLRVDFLNATRKFAVESSGEQHRSYNPFFHKNRLGYAASFQRDVVKAEFLEANGYTFIEIFEEDLADLPGFFQQHGISV